MSEFFAMSGYGYFIWMSYGITALFMLIEVIALLRGKRTVMKRLTRLANAESRKPATGSETNL